MRNQYSGYKGYKTLNIYYFEDKWIAMSKHCFRSVKEIVNSIQKGEIPILATEPMPTENRFEELKEMSIKEINATEEFSKYYNLMIVDESKGSYVRFIIDILEKHKTALKKTFETELKNHPYYYLKQTDFISFIVAQILEE